MQTSDEDQKWFIQINRKNDIYRYKIAYIGKRL